MSRPRRGVDFTSSKRCGMQVGTLTKGRKAGMVTHGLVPQPPPLGRRHPPAAYTPLYPRWWQGEGSGNFFPRGQPSLHRDRADPVAGSAEVHVLPEFSSGIELHLLTVTHVREAPFSSFLVSPLPAQCSLGPPPNKPLTLDSLVEVHV